MFIGWLLMCVCGVLIGNPGDPPISPCECQMFAVYQFQNNDGSIREERVPLGDPQPLVP